MKNVFILVAALGMTAPVMAEQTVAEKAEVKVNNAKRAMKKGAHRVEEKLCAKSDAKCLADKAENRAIEAKDYAKDKAEELKDKVDNK